MSLKYAILGFLSFRPFTGYELKKAFDRSVRHFWPANQSQIYRTLAELDQEGLVEKDVIVREERLDLKVYSITPTGRTELHRWLSTPASFPDNREPFLIQVYFGGQLSDTEVLRLLECQAQAARDHLQLYTAIYQSIYDQPGEAQDPRALYFSMLTLEYGLAASRALLKWAQCAMDRIRAGDYSPADLSNYWGNT